MASAAQFPLDEQTVADVTGVRFEVWDPDCADDKKGSKGGDNEGNEGGRFLGLVTLSIELRKLVEDLVAASSAKVFVPLFCF